MAKTTDDGIHHEGLHPIGKKLRWIERERNTTRMFWSLAAICGLLVVINLFHGLHGYLDVEEIPAIYAITGFVALTFVALASRVLRLIIRRGENYYGNHGVDGETYPDEGLEIRENGDA